MELMEAQERSLTERVADQVRRYTYGRIRNLLVEERRGQVVVSGEVRTWHTKQLAMQAALEMMAGDRFCEQITVVKPAFAEG